MPREVAGGWCSSSSRGQQCNRATRYECIIKETMLIVQCRSHPSDHACCSIEDWTVPSPADCDKLGLLGSVAAHAPPVTWTPPEAECSLPDALSDVAGACCVGH